VPLKPPRSPNIKKGKNANKKESPLEEIKEEEASECSFIKLEET
jgi:hypothetical protein